MIYLLVFWSYLPENYLWFSTIKQFMASSRRLSEKIVKGLILKFLQLSVCNPNKNVLVIPLFFRNRLLSLNILFTLRSLLTLLEAHFRDGLVHPEFYLDLDFKLHSFSLLYDLKLLQGCLGYFLIRISTAQANMSFVSFSD